MVLLYVWGLFRPPGLGPHSRMQSRGTVVQNHLEPTTSAMCLLPTSCPRELLTRPGGMLSESNSLVELLEHLILPTVFF
jgi:hypothetical protein